MNTASNTATTSTNTGCVRHTLDNKDLASIALTHYHIKSRKAIPCNIDLVDYLAGKVAGKRAKFHLLGTVRHKTIDGVKQEGISTTGTGTPLDRQAITELTLAARAALLEEIGKGNGLSFTSIKYASKKAAQELHHSTREKVFSSFSDAEKANDRAWKAWREQEGIEGYEIDKARYSRLLGNLKRLRKAFRLYWQAKAQAGYKKSAWALKHDLKRARIVALSPFRGGYTLPKENAAKVAMHYFQTRAQEALTLLK